MGLSEKAIKEFKEIYRRELGEEISDEKAQELGQDLISLFNIIYRPIPEGYSRKLQQKDKENNAQSGE